MLSWGEVLKSLCFWGPGAVIAGLIIVAFYKLGCKALDKAGDLVKGFAGDFVGAQQAQAESLAKLAQGTEGLRDTIQGFVTKDNAEHREMLILQKCIMEKLERLEEREYGG
jgi:hypothetical protein